VTGQAVRWGVDVILTDETKRWLDLRAALDGGWQTWWGYSNRLIRGFSGDYDRVGARYTRLFLWTGPLYYTAVQYAHSLLTKRKLEKIAGSFDHVDNEVNTRAAIVV